VQRVSAIVAGAGPAGSVAAWRLAQQGIDVLLLESLPATPEDMRASTMHPPTLDMLEELGLLDPLEAQGLRAPVYQYRNRETGEVISLDMSELGDVLRHPYRLQCEQFKLTRLIAAKLAAHPHGRILFDRKIVGYDQDAGGVTVTVSIGENTETYRADYLIGADGANSAIRKRMGVTFDGFTYPEKFLTLSTAFPIENHIDQLAYVAYMADSTEWCVLLRVPDFWRVLVPASEAEDDARVTSDEKKTEVFNRLVGDGTQVVTGHRTVYRVHQRVANTYRQERVLLIGDAAHLNNPLGGFGMNSGIHDAWNLTGRLTKILTKGADANAELDLYVRQRRTVMREFVQAQTIRNKAALEAGTAASQAALQAVLKDVVADPAKRRAYMLNQGMVTSLEREAEIT
jgi:3-(3-hydroxy-phenyl)propionate hydroxylase